MHPGSGQINLLHHSDKMVRKQLWSFPERTFWTYRHGWVENGQQFEKYKLLINYCTVFRQKYWPFSRIRICVDSQAAIKALSKLEFCANLFWSAITHSLDSESCLNVFDKSKTNFTYSIEQRNARYTVTCGTLFMRCCFAIYEFMMVYMSIDSFYGVQCYILFCSKLFLLSH